MRVESALAEAKPAMESGVMADSAPPVTTIVRPVKS